MILKSPVEAFWCITNRCNLNCRFCLADSTNHAPANELDRKQRKFVLSELINNRVLKVYITGGEPMLCPEIFDYIATLRENNIFVELTTNGTLLHKRNVLRLKKQGLNRVQVSINGATADTNDYLMGKSYHRIVNALRLLVKHRINSQVKITVTRQNVREIPQLIRRCTELGIHNIDIAEVHPLGRAFENWNLLSVAVAEVLWLEKKIKQMPEYQQYDISFNSSTIQALNSEIPPVCTIGAENSYSCLILSDGQVIPCTFAIVWKVENSILTAGLKNAWDQVRQFKKFVDSSKLTGKCGECEVKSVCNGGCRALACLFSGDIWGEYPFCQRMTQNKKVSYG